MEQKQIKKYLDDIGLTPVDVFLEIINNLTKIIDKLIPDKIEDVFIPTWFEGINITYSGMDFITNGSLISFSGFSPDSKIIITTLRQTYNKIQIVYKDYDFTSATPQSYLNVTLSTKLGTILVSRAVGKNCDYLRDIVQKYYYPNLRLTTI